MLLILSVNSLRTKLEADRKKLGLLDVPHFVHEHLGLQGLALQTRYLKGWDQDQIDRLRDQADKKGCPCLLLIEEEALLLGTPSESEASAAADRMERVLRVANRLGCSGVAMAIDAPADPAALELTAGRLKKIVHRAERLEMNLMISPRPGLTQHPDHLTALIRKVGGFRIGSMPDFQVAAATADYHAYLRALTPYATAVMASCMDFDAKGAHKAFAFEGCVKAITSVGYDGTVALEYRGRGEAIDAITAGRALIESVVEPAEE